MTVQIYALSVTPAKAGVQKKCTSRLTLCQFYYETVNILASKRNGTLYVGITSDLVKRVWNHKNGLVDGFTKKYGIKMLVYYENHENAQSAIIREKQIKKWRRLWKLRLIEEKNPEWRDLYDDICQ